MHRLGYFALTLGFVISSHQAVAADKVSVKFTNKSDFSIHHLFLSGTKEEEWGPDQLGDASSDTIDSGDSFTLTDISPNKYDLKIVDEDQDECVISGVKIAASETVTITNEDLVGCQVASAESDKDNG